MTLCVPYRRNKSIRIIFVLQKLINSDILKECILNCFILCVTPLTLLKNLNWLGIIPGVGFSNFPLYASLSCRSIRNTRWNIPRERSAQFRREFIFGNYLFIIWWQTREQKYQSRYSFFLNLCNFFSPSIISSEERESIINL